MSLVKYSATRSKLVCVFTILWALLPASVLLAGERVRVELTNGDRLEGELLRRDEARVHLMVGDSLVTLEAGRVKTVKGLKEKSAITKKVQNFGLYSTARLPERDMPSLVEELGPAIAVVKTPVGLGTGWFCNRDGYLVTNHHVVAGERNIRVTVFPRQGKTLGHKVYRKVRIVALNAEMDLALLKVEEELGVDLPQLSLSAAGSPKVGDKAFAIGNPLGLERSTSQGIVSKVGRNIGGRLFIQTTAPIAPGNSGGPLFNARGEVIGVVSRGAILLDGLGFAIPSAYVKEFLDNVEAFAYDEDNPNNGIQYMEAPVSSSDGRVKFKSADFIRTGRGLCCMTSADLDRDGIAEVIFADNNKSELAVLKKRGRRDKTKGPVDEWDINLLPESKRFKIESFPVSSRISALAVGELTGDKHQDIVFYGEPGGLGLLAGLGGGRFAPKQKIAEVQAAGTEHSLQVADLDRDGKQDIFILGRDVFTILWGAKERSEYVLDGVLRSKVKKVAILDVDRDRKRRLDLVFFVNSTHHGAHLRIQGAGRSFHQGQPLPSQISGPVSSLKNGASNQFVTLDPGINRVRRLSLVNKPALGRSSGREHSLLSIPVARAGSNSVGVDLLDVDGDGRDEILAMDQGRSEFVFIDYGKGGFGTVRSPAPKAVAVARLYRTPAGKAVVFSFSKVDGLLGVSRLEKGRVSFPRPIHTAGEVQWMQLESLSGLGDSKKKQDWLLWVEKSAGGQELHMALAQKAAQPAFDGRSGSIDLASGTLTFGKSEKRQSKSLPGKVKRFSFADFNGDQKLDLVVFWAYSGKETLYLGHSGQSFVEVGKRQSLIDEGGKQALLIQDLDGDGRPEVLQAQPGFVRILRVDSSRRLYIHQQLNWDHGQVQRLASYGKSRGRATLIAVNGQQAEIVRLSDKGRRFESLVRIDLTGTKLESLAVGDLDGDRRPDLAGWSQGVVQIMLNKVAERRIVGENAMNASLNHFRYWNMHTADLDRDGRDEVLLFDNMKSVFEILRVEKKGTLKSVFRHRLFNANFQKGHKRVKSSQKEPRAVTIADVNGDQRPDLIFVLHDRVAIYLQGK